MKLSFAVEPRKTAYMLKQGFGHAPGTAVLVIGRLTWALTW